MIRVFAMSAFVRSTTPLLGAAFLLGIVGLGFSPSTASAQFQLEDPSLGDGDGEDEDFDEDLDEIEPPVPEEELEAIEEENLEEAEEIVEEQIEEENQEEQRAIAVAQDPQDPNRGGTTVRFGPPPELELEGDFTLPIPPFWMEQRGDVRTTMLLPFFYSRTAPEDDQIAILNYYQRRSQTLNADVLFPIFFSFRGVDSLTLAIPPMYFHESPGHLDFGLAPLVFHGHDEDSSFTLIPPLLTFAVADAEDAYTIAGPFWRVRNGQRERFGLFPFLWVDNDVSDSSFMLAPFFFHFEDELDDSALTVVPPIYHRAWGTPELPEDEEDERSGAGAYFGAAPLFHHYHDQEGFSLTLPPLLFHYSNFNEDTKLITPLFAYFDAPEQNTLLTPLYQRHRGETELDAVFPVFFSERDPRQLSSFWGIPPLIWASDSPASATTVVAPFFARFHEVGDYETWLTPLVGHYENSQEASAGTWVFPNIQFSHTPTSSTFNLHPLLYTTSGEDYSHFVIPPVFFDVDDQDTGDDYRTTILFPLFWRFRNRTSVDQVIGNTYYRYRKNGGIPGWEFHFFPFFSYGEPRPGDHFWNVLYGLVGYRRQGSYAEGQAFWIPFTVDEPD